MSRVASNQNASAKSEWIRLFEENRELQTELRRLVEDFGYTSLPNDNRRIRDEVIRWLDETDLDTQRRFYQKLEGIAVRHSIPKRLRGGLLNSFIIGSRNYNLDDSVTLRVTGAPGKKHKEILIGARADLSDPFTLEVIRHYQRKIILDTDPPIRPVENERGKLDWRPLREWYERNCVVFTLEELASHLGYQASYLRRKLSEVSSPK